MKQKKRRKRSGSGWKDAEKSWITRRIITFKNVIFCGNLCDLCVTFVVFGPGFKDHRLTFEVSEKSLLHNIHLKRTVGLFSLQVVLSFQIKTFFFV